MNTNDEVLSVEDAMASGDLDQIEKALAAVNYSESEQDEAETTDVEESAEAEETAEEGESDGDTSDQEEAIKRVIKSKDGKHEIPYDVLERARESEKAERERANQLEKELADFKAKNSQAETQLNNVKAQLESRGIDATEAFSDPDKITEAELRELEEDYGVNSAIAKSTRIAFKLQQQAEASAVQVQQKIADQKPDQEMESLYAALQGNSDLSSWQASNPDRWDMAVIIDQRLSADPEWSGKTHAERFAEVAKRTKSAFGDPLTPEKSAKDKAKEIIDKTGQPVPDSLSDIGQAPTHDKSLIDRLSSMTPAQQENAMRGLSQAEINEILDAG